MRDTTKTFRFVSGLLLGASVFGSFAMAQSEQSVQATKATQVENKAAATSVSAKATEDTQAMIGMTAQDVGVMDRPRPAYDAKGIPLGGFRLFPTLDVSGNYDDNVFRQPDGLDDYFLTIDPRAYLRSQWGRHFVELYGGSHSYFYSDYTDENLTDWNYGMDVRLDVTQALTASVNTYYSEQHEPWQTPNTDTGYQAEPNRYFQTHSDATVTYKANRVGLELGGALTDKNYRYTPLIGGGTQDNNDRDQTQITGYGQVSYDFSPGYAGFVKATYDERDFSQFYDRSGNHRSSHGYHVDGGLNLQLTHLLSGQVFLGYMAQNYSTKVEATTDTPLSDFSGLDYGAKLDWYADPMLTVHLAASRTLSDVTAAGSSGADNKNVSLSADYEMFRNFILNGNVSYMESKYVGNTRKYKYPGFGLGGIYMMNEYLSLDLKYTYSKRSANIDDADFTDNLLSLTVKSHI